MTAPRKATPKPKPKSRPKPANGPKTAPEAPANKTIVFKGREIEVVQPTHDQLYVWDRVLGKVQDAAQQVKDVDQARRLLNKCDAIINAIIAKESDREWLEDALVGGTVTLEESVQIVVDAIKAYEDELKGEPANRAARRAKA